MKYLKKYNDFNEEADFDVDPKDTTNVKKSKENLTKVRKDIDNYNKQKAQIDTIYKTSKSEAEIDKRVDALLGKDKEKRNPYLINYLTVSNSERKLRSIKDDRINNKLRADEYRDLMDQTDNPDQKKAMSLKVAELNKKNVTGASNLTKLKAEADKRKSDISSSSSKNLKEIEDDIKNITKNIKK